MSILERKKREEIKKKEKYKVTELKYRVKKKVLNVVLEELKQRIQAKATKIKSMIKEMNSIELTDCSNKINKECTNSWMEKLKIVKSLTQEKVGDFGATFWEQERVTRKWLLNR